jgi:hypothetical protein
VSTKGKDGGGTESGGVTAAGIRDEDKFNDDDERGGDGSGSAGGTRDGEMEDTSEVGQKRKRYITVVDQAGKKRKVVDIVSGPWFLLPPFLHAPIYRIRSILMFKLRLRYSKKL